MTALLYVAELAVIVGAVPLTLWLRREGDEPWRRCRFAVHLAPMARAFAQLRLTIADQLTPALRHATKSLAAFAEAWGFREAVSDELVRLTLGGRPERPELVHTDPNGAHQ